MIRVQRNYLLDYCILMVNKNFHIKISEEVEINFIPIVSYRHDERTFFVQHINFLLERQLFIFLPHDHEFNIQ